MQPRITLAPQTPREFTLMLGVGFAALLFCALLFAVMSMPPVPQVVFMLSIVVGLFFFTKPEIALLTFFGLRVCFDLLWWVPVRIMSLNVMELFSGAVAALAVLLFYLELKRFNRHPLVIPFIPYVVVICIAAVRNLDVREGVEILARYLSTFLLMFLVTAFMSDTYKRIRMHVFFTITSVIPIAVSMYFLISGKWGLELAGYNRLVGGYHNLHNHALMMMLFSALGAFWLLYVRKVGFTLVFMAYSGCALAALYFSYVRNAQLGLVVCIAVLLALHKRWGLLALGLVGLVAAVSLSQTLQDRFDDLFLFFSDEYIGTERSKLGSGRWELWTVSMGEYLKYPLGDLFLGLGLGKQRFLTQPLYSAHYYDPKIGYIDPHNDYLSLLYQMGPVSVICYVVFQVQVIRYGLLLSRIGRNSWAREFGLFMVALSCTVFATNFMSNAFLSRVTLGWYYWGMAGLLFGEAVDTRDELAARDKLKAEAALAEHKDQSKGNGPDPPRDSRLRRPGAMPQPGMRHSRRGLRFPWSRGRSGGHRRRR